MKIKTYYLIKRNATGRTSVRVSEDFTSVEDAAADLLPYGFDVLRAYSEDEFNALFDTDFSELDEDGRAVCEYCVGHIVGRL